MFKTVNKIIDSGSTLGNFLCITLIPVWIAWGILDKVGLAPQSCWWHGHKWRWIYDDEDAGIFRAGDCQRCGEIGDGIIAKEPEYDGKEISDGISKKGDWGNTERDNLRSILGEL
jgi:hypothetical protein